MDGRTVNLAAAFLLTPPIWTGCQFGLEQFKMPEVDLSRLSGVRIGTGMRLGHTMESVFLALLKGQDTYELIDRNVVVKRDKKTMGEIDFLLRDRRDGCAVHLELTYKFYLIDTEISEPIYQLVGPNRRDMFFTKLDKLRDSQFALPHTEEGKRALEERKLFGERLSQKVCFKAQLFKPYRLPRVGIRPLNTACITGFWLRFEQFQDTEFTKYRYALPSKEEWVVTPYDKYEWMSHLQVLLEINLHLLRKSATMVWMRKGRGFYEKFFVVWW